MQGLWNLLERSSLLACAALWLSLTDCSGAAFSGPDRSGGSAGEAGGGGSAAGSADGGRGGHGGSDEQAGSPGEVGGSGGSGGAASSGCMCPSGQYCREASRDCFSCASLDRLRFTTPERIATLSDTGRGARFPRAGAASSDLFYRSEGAGLRYTSDASTSPGSSLTATDVTDSAPLLVDSALAGLSEGVDLVFDRAVPGSPRALYLARWSDGLAEPELAPAPFNSGLGDYSMAVARRPVDDAPVRAFWMSARNASDEAPAPELLTAEASADAEAEAVTLRLGAGKCEVADSEAGAEPDLTPWVSADGRMLVFSTTKLEPDCSVSNQKKDLYAMMLRPDTGQPLDATSATPLMDVNSRADDTDPSFSADLCDLYFASNRDGKYAIYRARRR